MFLGKGTLMALLAITVQTVRMHLFMVVGGVAGGTIGILIGNRGLQFDIFRVRFVHAGHSLGSVNITRVITVGINF